MENWTYAIINDRPVMTQRRGDIIAVRELSWWERIRFWKKVREMPMRER